MISLWKCWLITVLAGLLLSGCSSLPVVRMASTAEAGLFADGLDQFIASGDLQILRRLPQEYPHGQWRPRAEAVIALVEQQSLGSAKPHPQKTPAGQQALARCQNEINLLTQNNRVLEETLQKLKQLLIDMELQSN